MVVVGVGVAAAAEVAAAIVEVVVVAAVAVAVALAVAVAVAVAVAAAVVVVVLIVVIVVVIIGWYHAIVCRNTQHSLVGVMICIIILLQHRDNMNYDACCLASSDSIPTDQSMVQSQKRMMQIMTHE